MVAKVLTTKLVVIAAIAITPALAADLDTYEPPQARHQSPYDDPRYGDVYRHPPPPPRAYVERYDERAYPPPNAYRRETYACVPREAIRADLTRRGWYDFHDLDVAGDVVHVRARRPSGAMFQLTLDRCSGQIVDRRLVAGPPRAFAWRDRGPLPPGY
jgi:hypothetical protein